MESPIFKNEVYYLQAEAESSASSLYLASPDEKKCSGYDDQVG